MQNSPRWDTRSFKGVLIDAFFVSPKLPIDNVTLCRPSPGVVRGGIRVDLCYIKGRKVA